MKKFKDILKESPEVIEEAQSKEFWRLPKHVIGNDLYSAMKDLKEIYDWVKNGNDFKPGEFDMLMSTLEGIKKSAKKFTQDQIEDAKRF